MLSAIAMIIIFCVQDRDICIFLAMLLIVLPSGRRNFTVAEQKFLENGKYEYIYIYMYISGFLWGEGELGSFFLFVFFYYSFIYRKLSLFFLSRLQIMSCTKNRERAMKVELFEFEGIQQQNTEGEK